MKTKAFNSSQLSGEASSTKPLHIVYQEHTKWKTWASPGGWEVSSKDASTNAWWTSLGRQENFTHSNNSTIYTCVETSGVFRLVPAIRYLWIMQGKGVKTKAQKTGWANCVRKGLQIKHKDWDCDWKYSDWGMLSGVRFVH